MNSPFNSNVLNVSAARSLRDSPCRRHCRKNVGWFEDESLRQLIPELSSILQLLVAHFFARLDSFSDSVAPASAVVCKQLPAVWIDACEFQVAFADVLKAQYWAACWVNCNQLTVHGILCIRTSFMSSHVLTPSRTAWHQPLQSSASSSQLSGSMPLSFRSRLQTSLKRNTGRQAGW